MENIEKLLKVKEELVHILFPNDTERRELIMKNDPHQLRKLSHFNEKGISSDELLESVDFTLLEKANNLLKQGNTDALKDINLDTLIYIGKIAKRQKISDLVYKISIMNMNMDSEELHEGLDMLGLEISCNEELHELKLTQKEAK